MQSMAASMLHEQVQCAYAKPSLRSIIAALKSCSSNSKLTLQDGKQLHACIVEEFSSSNILAANSLIDMYAKCKSLDDAFNLFFHLKERDLVSWNAIIGGSTLNGECDKALQLFEQMLVEDIRPDRVTILCTLKACATSTFLTKGLQVHVYVLSNSRLWEDVKVKNTLIDMYCKCGTVERAKHVFNSSTIMSVVTWNAMILGYTQQGDSGKAFELFQEMQSSGVDSNENTCVSILRACCTKSTLPDGMLVYFFVMEKGMDRDACIDSALVNMYSKCGALEDAHEVFRQARGKDVVIWAALIGGYADNGRYFEALDLFEKMLQHGVEPNYVAYLGIIKVCTNLASLDHGRRIHSYIKHSRLEVVTTLGNALIDMYLKCGGLQDAHDVFNNLVQRDVVSWSTFIAGNVELGLFEEGFLLFKHMQKEGHEPSCITLAYLFKACSSMNALAEGKLAHAFSVELSVECLVLTRNTLVFMYVNCKSFEDACSVFRHSSKEDVDTWNAMIGGCLDYRTSLQYYTNMLQSGLKPNEITFVGLLSACSHTGLVNEGLDHFRSMTANFGILASFEHYNCIIDLLGRVGRVAEAGLLRSTMPFEVNAIVETSLLSNSKMAGNINIYGGNYQGVDPLKGLTSGDPR
ncbi:hypothetical protein GOP47_0018320 [Adiantum capillus-veneris]|uniref:Pentatricopeptide repeat-containing protein n=1 Tax=Adiantum capillus-veneris TaxID=13818 RepID=A0A9D4ZBH1_ADICA|nr:hypothetical protein GOP47_0018320 [Adiantum capillus-veneris]